MRKVQGTKLSEAFTLYLASAAARGVKDKTFRTCKQQFNAISKRLDVDGKRKDALYHYSASATADSYNSRALQHYFKIYGLIIFQTVNNANFPVFILSFHNTP